LPIPEDPKQRTVDARVLELLAYLERGELPSEELRRRLETTLAQNNTTRPVPHIPVARQSESVASESGLDRSNLWLAFQRKVSRDELEALSDVDIQFIDRVTPEIKKVLIGFRVSDSKPLGADISKYSEDYSGFDLSGTIDFKALGEMVTRSLSNDLKNLAGKTWEDFNTVQVFNHPQKEDLQVIQFRFFSPPNTNPIDNRPIASNYSLVIQKGPALEALLSPNCLRLLPFIVKSLGMNISDDLLLSGGPDRRVFFDASLAGPNKIFGKASNPIVLLSYPERKVARVYDTRKVDSVSTVSCRSDGEFINEAKKESSVRSSGKVELFGGGNPKKIQYKRAN